MSKVIDYLDSKGIEIVRDDGHELACYCPFHSNSATPAFYINKKSGLWICFNPSCGKKGSLKDLMVFYGDSTSFVKEYSIEDIESLFRDEAKAPEERWEETLDKIKVDNNNIHTIQYLLNRGFTKETCFHFEIGFSEKKHRIVIPVRNERHHIVGVIGRTTLEDVQPKYLYSKGLPRKDVLFNLNQAKMYESVVIVEGSLDAMKIHQAGHPNVVASLGAALTDQHGALLRQFFNEVIIFSDNDHAGYAMRDLIIEKCFDMNLRIAKYPSNDIKDPGEMSAEQITAAIQQAEDCLSWTLSQ